MPPSVISTASTIPASLTPGPPNGFSATVPVPRKPVATTSAKSSTSTAYNTAKSHQATVTSDSESDDDSGELSDNVSDDGSDDGSDTISVRSDSSRGSGTTESIKRSSIDSEDPFFPPVTFILPPPVRAASDPTISKPQRSPYPGQTFDRTHLSNPRTKSRRSIRRYKDTPRLSHAMSRYLHLPNHAEKMALENSTAASKPSLGPTKAKLLRSATSPSTGFPKPSAPSITSSVATGPIAELSAQRKEVSAKLLAKQHEWEGKFWGAREEMERKMREAKEAKSHCVMMEILHALSVLRLEHHNRSACHPAFAASSSGIMKPNVIEKMGKELKGLPTGAEEFPPPESREWKRVVRAVRKMSERNGWK